MFLKQMGYQVLLAASGTQGIELYTLHQTEIDLVLLDMTMLDMTGKDCFYALRSLNPHVKIIIASGYSQNNIMKSMTEDGLNGFIGKPYRQAQLSHIIHTVLNQPQVTGTDTLPTTTDLL